MHRTLLVWRRRFIWNLCFISQLARDLIESSPVFYLGTHMSFVTMSSIHIKHITNIISYEKKACCPNNEQKIWIFFLSFFFMKWIYYKKECSTSHPRGNLGMDYRGPQIVCVHIHPVHYHQIWCTQCRERIKQILFFWCKTSCEHVEYITRIFT